MALLRQLQVGKKQSINSNLGLVLDVFLEVLAVWVRLLGHLRPRIHVRTTCQGHCPMPCKILCRDCKFPKEHWQTVMWSSSALASCFRQFVLLTSQTKSHSRRFHQNSWRMTCFHIFPPVSSFSRFRPTRWYQKWNRTSNCPWRRFSSGTSATNTGGYIGSAGCSSSSISCSSFSSSASAKGKVISNFSGCLSFAGSGSVVTGRCLRADS